MLNRLQQSEKKTNYEFSRRITEADNLEQQRWAQNNYNELMIVLATFSMSQTRSCLTKESTYVIHCIFSVIDCSITQSTPILCYKMR